MRLNREILLESAEKTFEEDDAVFDETETAFGIGAETVVGDIGGFMVAYAGSVVEADVGKETDVVAAETVSEWDVEVAIADAAFPDKAINYLTSSLLELEENTSPCCFVIQISFGPVVYIDGVDAGHGGSDGVHGYMYSLDAAVNDLKIIFLYRNHGICDKNPSVVVHRPITRKIATQISNQNQPCQVETKKPVQNSSSIMIEKVSNKVLIDVDEYRADSSFSDPMFVKHTEAILDEFEIFEDIDLMEEEVEMEDIVEELILDIDSCDSKNTLAVLDYINDIYAHYKKTENSSCVSPNYMVQQSNINEKMRVILVDWLIEVHDKFELMDETLFLMVNIIDRFLAHQTVERKKLQLVGITAMLLACKYEEVSVPVVDDLILISDKAYTRKQVLDMVNVSLLINKLQFNMSAPTSYVFMKRFLKTAQSDKKLELLSFFLIELSLVDHDMLRLPPSLLVVASIYTTQFTLNRTRHWSKTTEWHSYYSEDQLQMVAGGSGLGTVMEWNTKTPL
ncbi:G2/mitotic-specific cyclin-2-like [Papaver somniferum]|uniref:G2/mitotic-specific cyclin-2-like n=1 Tax=Papaver somniferum TaxID=3469 RepID=UPI000E6FABA1|nr:G2/mitotic-specific cyclin-2-like [Papaver somniferum]